MPLDKILARKLVSGARSAYARGIHSEYINKLADQLDAALALSDEAVNELNRARNEAARLQRELDEEKTHYRKLREQSAHTETAMAVLREISQSPKGAAKKAADQLALMGAIEPVSAPEKVVVP